MKEPITFRPSDKVTKYLISEKKKRKSASINNTIEQIILEHKKGGKIIYVSDNTPCI